MAELRLALYQPAPTRGDAGDALVRMAAMARASALAGADMLLLPELYLPGYNRPDLHGAQAQGLDGPWIEQAAQIARESGIALTFGLAERAGKQVFNTAVTLSAGGEVVAQYRKIQPFGAMEEAGFTPGDRYCTFTLAGRRMALLICFDIEYPAHARALAARGVDLILVPTANPAGYPHVSDVIVPARAAENGLTVAYANYAGQDGDLRFEGGSVVAGPGGAILARAGGHEALLITTLPAPGAGGELHAPVGTERPAG